MSQTETLLLFVLGFSVALFVVLLFGRGVWALMGSWASWSEARRVPAAIRELQAERDSLKAEKAMLAQKLEASLGDMKMRMAEQMAEVSRNRNRLLDMGQTLKERESTIAHLQTQADDKTAQLAALNVQIEENVKSINLAYAKMAKRDEDHTSMQNVLKDAQATLLQRDEKVRNLQDETKALRDMLAGLQATAASPGQRKPIDFETPLLADAAPVRLAPVAAPQLASRFDTAEPDPLLAATSLVTNPLLEGPHDALKPDMMPESDLVDRSMSNVLSLAERVRSLQTGMKKA
jgi:hypothetical protein